MERSLRVKKVDENVLEEVKGRDLRGKEVVVEVGRKAEDNARVEMLAETRLLPILEASTAVDLELIILCF